MPLFDPPPTGTITIDADGFVLLPGQPPIKAVIETDSTTGEVRTAIVVKDVAAGVERVPAESIDEE
jgi:hypothetical protein